MKEVTKTTIVEKDEHGNIIKQTETTIEKYFVDEKIPCVPMYPLAPVQPWYGPYNPYGPYFYTTEITCASK